MHMVNCVNTIKVFLVNSVGDLNGFNFYTSCKLTCIGQYKTASKLTPKNVKVT